jgi:hypothetical protein
MQLAPVLTLLVMFLLPTLLTPGPPRGPLGEDDNRPRGGQRRKWRHDGDANVPPTGAPPGGGGGGGAARADGVTSDPLSAERVGSRAGGVRKEAALSDLEDVHAHKGYLVTLLTGAP